MDLPQIGWKSIDLTNTVFLYGPVAGAVKKSVVRGTVVF